MTKTHLIEQVAARTGHTRKDTEQLVDAVLEQVAASLASGEKIDLRGFGSFQVSAKKERQGRNPKTGETITIAARNAVAFKPGKELTAAVNAGSGGTGKDDEMAEPSEGSAKVHGDKIDI